MSFGIEVGMVVGSLEVLATEVGILHVDWGLASVENGDVLLLAHFADGADDWLETGTVDVPRCDEANLSPWVLLAQTLTE